MFQMLTPVKGRKKAAGWFLVFFLFSALVYAKAVFAFRDDSAVLTIQRVALLGSVQLNMELRYINNKLGYVYFSNTGAPLVITIYGSRYQLADHGNLTLPALDLINFVLTVTNKAKKEGELSQFNAVKTYIFVRDPTGFYRLDTFY